MQQTPTEPGLHRLAEVLANVERYWFDYNFGTGDQVEIGGNRLISFSEVVPVAVYSAVTDRELLALSDRGSETAVFRQLAVRQNHALDVAVAVTKANGIAASEALGTLGRSDKDLLWQRLFETVPMLKEINRLWHLPRSQIGAQELSQLTVAQANVSVLYTGSMYTVGRAVKAGVARSDDWKRWKKSLDNLTLGYVVRSYARQAAVIQDSGFCDVNGWTAHIGQAVVGEAVSLQDSLRQLYKFSDAQWAAVISMVYRQERTTGPDALRSICQAVVAV